MVEIWSTYNDQKEQELRKSSSRQSENVRDTHTRSIRPLPSHSSLRQPPQHTPFHGSSSQRGRETPLPQSSSSSRRGRETPPPQYTSSVQRNRETPPPQSRSLEEGPQIRERQQQDSAPVASMSEARELELEVLEITLSLLTSYPPPPTIVVAPPSAVPCFTSPPSDLDEHMETPKARKVALLCPNDKTTKTVHSI